MALRHIGAEHEIRLGAAQRLHLRAQRAAMVGDMLRAALAGPGRRLGAQGGGDDIEFRQLPGQLYADQAHSAGAADDEQRLAGVRSRARDAHAVEQSLPGGDGGEGQRRGLGKAQRVGLVSRDALIDQVQLGVAA